MNSTKGKGLTETVRKVLVIDSSLERAMSLARCFEDMVDEIQHFDCGEKSQESLLGADLVVAFIACTLSDISGLELVKKLRAERGMMEVPVLLVADDQCWERVKFQAHELGVLDRVAQPFSVGLIRSRVRLCNEIFESRISNRTHQENLQRSNHEFRDFAFAAAHDLKAPLRTVRGLLAALDREHLSAEKAERYKELVYGSVERMNTMLSDMLDYAKVDISDVSFEPVELNRLVSDVILDLQSDIDSANAEIDCGLLPSVNGKRSQLRRLFQNILNNSLKYRRPDIPAKIRIQCAFEGSQVQVSVEDNGIGFDMKHIESVFRPFKRLVASTEIGGSGIGMATARRIVEQHRGSISASSELGQGAVFYVHLPITAAQISSYRQQRKDEDSQEAERQIA